MDNCRCWFIGARQLFAPESYINTFASSALRKKLIIKASCGSTYLFITIDGDIGSVLSSTGEKERSAGKQVWSFVGSDGLAFVEANTV